MFINFLYFIIDKIINLNENKSLEIYTYFHHIFT